MTDEMRIHTPSGEILARDNFVIAFFGRRPFAEMAAGARAAVEQWLKIVPSDCLKWALVGKSSTKYQKLTPQVVKRCFVMLDKDILKIAPAAIRDTKVMLTVLGGRVVYERKWLFISVSGLVELDW
jgi:hypothetical protein